MKKKYFFPDWLPVFALLSFVGNINLHIKRKRGEEANKNAHRNSMERSTTETEWMLMAMFKNTDPIIGCSFFAVWNNISIIMMSDLFQTGRINLITSKLLLTVILLWKVKLVKFWREKPGPKRACLIVIEQ